MGHDIYARSTNEPDSKPEYFRANMSAPSAPLYRSLNAQDCYGGVSGNGGELNFNRTQITEAIQVLPTLYTDYLEIKPTPEQLRENYTWRFSEVEPKYEEWTQEETQGYYISHFASEIEFLIRCFNLFDEKTDSITISFC
jgi:hypothetical protein